MIDKEIAVSVAVITYNMQRYLPQLLDSKMERERDIPCQNYP